MTFLRPALLTLLLFATHASAADPGDAIDRLLRAGCLNPAATSVSVVDLTTGETIYAKNADTPLVPASVMKLFTTGAALHHLGPDYRFTTSIWATAAPVGGVVDGDLYIVGRGDPKLTPEAVWGMVTGLKRRGVDRVTGRLMIDAGFFDDLPRAPSWAAHRSTRAYDAKLGALSISFNTVAVEVYPADAPGKPLIVGLNPPSPYLTLDNRGTTVARRPQKVEISRSVVDNRLRITVTGSKIPGEEEAIRYVNVPDPDRFAAETFHAFLKEAGVTVEKGGGYGKKPADAVQLYVNRSEPLRVILAQLNRYSNNFVAEQVAKTMGAEVLGAPGSHEKAMKLIARFIDEIGAATPGTAFTDASGLSWENRVTTRQVTKLIGALHDRFDLGPDFIATLALMGAEGSVEKRLTHSPVARFARVKTGSLTGVSNIAGGVAANNGRRFAFAIFLNDNRCGYEGADRIEDAIVKRIYDDGSAP
jgi:D-alanyl-D-alanine carboxypeptidase/D-alanyl-D-alanine-endopeptidase (penicillin-binding protein 4)